MDGGPHRTHHIDVHTPRGSRGDENGSKDSGIPPTVIRQKVQNLNGKNPPTRAPAAERVGIDDGRARNVPMAVIQKLCRARRGVFRRTCARAMVS